MIQASLKVINYIIYQITNKYSHIRYVFLSTFFGLITSGNINAQGYIDCATHINSSSDYLYSANSYSKTVNGYTYFAIGYNYDPTIPSSFPVINGDPYDPSHAGSDGEDIYFAIWDPDCNQIIGTFIGGSGEDIVNYLTIDSSGNTYITGRTESSDWPTTNGTNQVGGTDDDVFLLKYAPDGTLLFSTVYGSPLDFERGEQILVDGTNVYLLGETKANLGRFPTTDGSSFLGNWATFVTKFDGNGNIIFSTIIGGDNDSYLNDAKLLDNNDLVFVGSNTASDFPTTDGSTTVSSFNDAYLTIMDSNGNITFCTVFGATEENDNIESIAIDGNFIYVGGETNGELTSTDGTSHSGFKDNFLRKYDISGNLIFSTILGSSNGDSFEDMLVSNGMIYLLGKASGSDYPLVNGTPYVGLSDIVLSKLDLNGNIIYSTYYGSTGLDNSSPSFEVNAAGEVFLLASINYNSSAASLTFIKFNSDGSVCSATTLPFSLRELEFATDIEVIEDTLCFVIEVASGYSTDGTISTYPTNGIWDLMVGKFVFCSPPTPIASDVLNSSTINVCINEVIEQIIGEELVIDGTYAPPIYIQGVLSEQPDYELNYQWQTSTSAGGPWSDIPGLLAQQKNYSPPPTVSDIYYRRIAKTSDCCGGAIVSTSTIVSILVGTNSAPIVDAGGPYNICPGNAITIGGIPAAAGGTAPYNYNWNNSTFTIENPIVNPTESTVYTLEVTDNNGCLQADQAIVNVYSADAGADTDICDGLSTTIGGSPLQGIEIVTNGDTPPVGQYSIEYDWTPKDGTLTCTDCPNPSATPSVATDYTLNVTLYDPSGSSCQTSDIVSIGIINPPPSTLTIPDIVLCLGETKELSTSPPHLGTTSISSINQSSTDTYTGTIANLTDDSVSTGARTNNGIGESITFDLGSLETINIIALGLLDYDYLFKIEVSMDNISYTDLGFIVDHSGANGRTLSYLEITEFIFSPTVVRYVRLSSTSAFKDVAISQFEAYYDYHYIWTPGSYIETDRISAIFDAGNLEMPTNNPITYTVSANLETCSFYEQVTVAVIEARAGKDPGCGPAIVGEDDRTPNIDETYSWAKITDPAITTGSGNLIGATNIPMPIVSASSGGDVGYELTVNFTLNGSTKTCKDTVIVGPICNPFNTCEIETAEGGCPAFDLGNPTMIAQPYDEIGNNWSYSWTSNLGTTGLDSYNTQTVNLTDNITRNYTVTMTNLLDPSLSCTATINANSASYSTPLLNVVHDVTVCKGASVNIGDPSNNPGLTYSWTNGHLLDNPNSNYPLVSPEVSTQFRLTVIDNITGCQAEEVIRVIVPISANAGSDLTVCDNGIVTLGINLDTLGFNYSWSPAASDWRNGTDQNDAMPDVFTASTQTFTLTAVDTLGICSTSDMMTVTIESLPSPFSLPDLTFCPNQAGDLVLGTDDGSSTGLNQVPNGYTYLWSPVGFVDDASLQNPRVSTPLPTSEYIFEVEIRTPGGCNQKASQTITPLTTATTVVSDQVICLGETIAIGSSSNATGGGITYSWSPNTDLDNATSPNPIFTPSIAGLITFTVVKSNGVCSTTSEVTITVEELTAPVLFPQTMCSGNSIEIGLTSEPDFSYEWVPSTGLDNAFISNPTFSGLNSTDFTLTIINQNGCSVETLTSVIVNPAPVITFNVPDIIICYDDISVFTLNNTVSPVGNYAYQWSPSDYLDNPNILNPSFFVPEAGSYEYELEIIDQSNGCSFIAIPSIDVYDNCCNIGPTINSVSDTLVFCDHIAVSSSPTVSHPFDSSPTIVYSEVKIQHPNNDWKSSEDCSILYNVTNGSFDDKGTISILDDEMSFTLTVIGKNVNSSWYTDINGDLINGSYYTNLRIDRILTNGPNVAFTIFDNNNASCSSTVIIDANDF